MMIPTVLLMQRNFHINIIRSFKADTIWKTSTHMGVEGGGGGGGGGGGEGVHSVGAYSIFVQFVPRSCSQICIRFNVVEHFARQKFCTRK